MLLCVEQKMKKGNIYTWITSAKIHKKLMTMIASGDRGGWGGAGCGTEALGCQRFLSLYALEETLI